MNKKFKFVIKRHVIVMMIAAYFLCLLGLFLNILKVVNWKDLTLWGWLSCILMLALCVLLIVFLTSAFIKAHYVITDDAVVAKYGLLKTKVRFKDIEEVIYKKKSDKLVIYYTGNCLLNVTINPNDYNEFVDSLKESCKDIKYSIDYEDVEDEKK